MNAVIGSLQVRKSLLFFCATSFASPSFAFLPRSPLRVRFHRLADPIISSGLLQTKSIRLSSSTPLAATGKKGKKGSSSKTNQDTIMTSEQFYEDLRVGGDFAGLQSKFRADDGTLIPLAENIIPESMIEWGQEPSSLEVLISEENGLGKDAYLLRRQTLTVLPEVGCGIDNLETQKSEELFPRETSQWIRPSESTLALDTTVTPSSQAGRGCIHKTETIFSLPDSHRVRVTINVNVQENNDNDDDEEESTIRKIESPIIIQLERQTSTDSTHGTRADGGGLDGRTVTTLLGDWLHHSRSFGEAKPVVQEKKETDKDSMSIIHLPGNITVANLNDKDFGVINLEVSHFSETKGSTRTIKRTFQVGGHCSSVDYKETNGKLYE